MGYVTVTLMTSDKQSYGLRMAVESKSKRRCNRQIRETPNSCLRVRKFVDASFANSEKICRARFHWRNGSAEIWRQSRPDGVRGEDVFYAWLQFRFDGRSTAYE